MTKKVAMPIENERKYVLFPTIERKLPLGDFSHKITQGYIKNSGEGVQIRLRKVEIYQGETKFDTRRFFTLKSKNADFTSTEVEMHLSESDFNAIWPKVHCQLTKTRYKVHEDSLCWEIDIFHGPDDNYFWMAEIELPSKQKWPASTPDYIEQNLLYKVPLTDERFSSRKLYDVAYATKLYKECLLLFDKGNTEETINFKERE